MTPVPLPFTITAGAGTGTACCAPPTNTTPSPLGTSAETPEHHALPKFVSVPHRTSACATNGLTYARTSGDLIPSGPAWRLPLLSNVPIAAQNASTKIVPIVTVRTPKIVIAVAAVVRRTMLEQNNPNDPSPMAV